MSSENQLLGHIYQTAEMGREGIRSVLKYAREPKLVDRSEERRVGKECRL